MARPIDVYRSDALDLTLREPKRNISLVDNIIRLMLDDRSVGAKGLITFNIGDFQDVCQKNRIDILYEPNRRLMLILKNKAASIETVKN